MILTTPRLNTLVLFFTLISLTFGTGAHGEMTSRPEWENELINSVGNEPARATSVPSDSLESALKVPTANDNSPRVQSLNGAWKFNWVPKPEERPVEFYQPDFDVSEWAEIPVPSNLEIEGYGPPIYLTSDYAFQNSYPEPIVTAEPPEGYTTFEQRNAVGSYRRDFTVSDEWKDQEIFLHFAGGGAAYYVWINGEKVGYFEDTFSPSEFRVTDLVKFGQPNTLAVELYRWADGSYIEDQDFFRLSGLFRDVFLWTCDPTHVRDFFITTDFDEDYRDASLDAEVSLRNLSPTDRDLTLRVQLFDTDSNQVASEQIAVQIPSGEERRVELSQAIPNPEKWSAESPYLYTTVVELLDEQNGDETVLDRRSCKTGFREVSISDKNELLINGTPVILKGVNRHGHDPETGHYEREELMLADVLLMKQNNVNCVRTAHYPNDPKFYRLLDEFGIYAIDEANLESHGLLGLKEESVSYNPKWEQAYLDRALTMVHRDKNHPSVIIWSMGNEGGGGQNYLRCSEETRKIDPSRLVFYDGFHDGHEGSDIDGSMYVPLPLLIERHGEPKKTRPYFHTEFGHSQGNSLGNLQEYVDAYEEFDQLMGGAIWDWVDQAIWVTREDGTRYLGYGGSWDEFPNSKNFGVNGVIFADRAQADKSPKLAEVRKTYQPVKFAAIDLPRGKISIENLHDFKDLADYEIDWSLSEEGLVVQSGVLEDFGLAPGATTTATIPWETKSGDSPTPHSDREYWLRLSVKLKDKTKWAEAGYDVAWEQFRMPFEREPVANLVESDDSPLVVDKSGDVVKVSGDEFTVSFDQKTGLIASLELGDETVLRSGSGDFHATRALTDNDFLMFDRSWFTRKYWEANFPDAPQQASLNLGSLTATMNSFDVEEQDADVVRIKVDRSFATAIAPWKFDVRTTWEIHPNGVIVSRNEVETNLPKANRQYVTSLGFDFILSESHDQFTWYGAGPHENYPDRRRAADVGFYKAAVEDMFVPYPKSQDFANREGVRWLALTQESGTGLLFMSNDHHVSASAKHYSRDSLSEGGNIVDVKKSEEVFLDVNFAQLGVGNGSCGECRPLDQYLTDFNPSETYVYAIVPIASDDPKRLAEIGRSSIEPIVQ